MYKIIKIPKWVPKFIIKFFWKSEHEDALIPEGCTLVLNENKILLNVSLGKNSKIDLNGKSFEILGWLYINHPEHFIYDSKATPSPTAFSIVKDSGKWAGGNGSSWYDRDDIWTCGLCRERNIKDNHKCI